MHLPFHYAPPGRQRPQVRPRFGNVACGCGTAVRMTLLITTLQGLLLAE